MSPFVLPHSISKGMPGVTGHDSDLSEGTRREGDLLWYI